MPYLITAKRSGLELRDGKLASDPMHKLVVGEPVLFQTLPNGYRLPGDAQVEIVVAVTPEQIIGKQEEPQPIEDEQPKRKHKKGR